MEWGRRATWLGEVINVFKTYSFVFKQISYIYQCVTRMSWFGSRGGLKFTKSSERPKVRLENRKSADLESRLNLKSGDEEVKGNTEEEGNFFLVKVLFIKNVLTIFVPYDPVFHPSGPVRGILKTVISPSKPPVPSRSRVNAVLGVRLHRSKSPWQLHLYFSMSR